VPLMEMDRTSLLCISTVLGSDNFYSKLLLLKASTDIYCLTEKVGLTLFVSQDEQGRSFFNKFEFYLACRACMDAGKAASCNHKMHELPHWQSGRKHQRIRAMMASMVCLTVLQNNSNKCDY